MRASTYATLAINVLLDLGDTLCRSDKNVLQCRTVFASGGRSYLRIEHVKR